MRRGFVLLQCWCTGREPKSRHAESKVTLHRPARWLPHCLAWLFGLLAIAPDVHAQEPRTYDIDGQKVANVPRSVGDTVVAQYRALLDVSIVVDDLDMVTAMESLPDGRMLTSEKEGRLLIHGPGKARKVAGILAVDTVGARGLLNVILHPDFADNRLLIIYYSAKGSPDSDKQRVATVRLGPDDRLQMNSLKTLVRGIHGTEGFEQGGGLVIDKDGKLYIGVGDGGCRAGKPVEPVYQPTNYNATCLTNANGKILRVNLDGSIPKDNPLVGVKRVTACGAKCGDDPWKQPRAAPRTDIWAWGVRNPWRLWVDPRTGNLWFVDDGDITHEEVNVITPRSHRHFGWPWREGAAGHSKGTCKRVKPRGQSCEDPAYYCRHGEAKDGVDGGCQSTGGGLIIDDCRWPKELQNRYILGDCSNGSLWSLGLDAKRAAIEAGSRRDFGRVAGMVVDMDLAPDGALLIGVFAFPPVKSHIVRIAPASGGTCKAR